jgi:hypothetical protein
MSPDPEIGLNLKHQYRMLPLIKPLTYAIMRQTPTFSFPVQVAALPVRLALQMPVRLALWRYHLTA